MTPQVKYPLNSVRDGRSRLARSRGILVLAALLALAPLALAQSPAEPTELAQDPGANAPIAPNTEHAASATPAPAGDSAQSQPAGPSDILKAAAHGRAPEPLVYPPASAEQRSNWGLLFEGALLDSDNGKDFRETGGYYKLLESLQAYTAEEVKGRTTRYLDWFAVMEDPNAWRGEFVRRRGVFNGARAIRLDRPFGTITDVWRCGVSDGDGTEGVVFDLLAPPDAAIEPRVDPIEIEGIFYRTARFIGDSDRPVEAPYLLVKNIRKIERDEMRSKGLFEGTALYVFAAALLFLGFRLVSVVRQQARRGYTSRREPMPFETIEQRAAQHRRAAKAPPAPPRAPPAPPRNPPPS